MPEGKRRQRSEPWKHIYGKDRKYTARVDRLRERIETGFARTNRQLGLIDSKNFNPADEPEP